LRPPPAIHPESQRSSPLRVLEFRMAQLLHSGRHGSMLERTRQSNKVHTACIVVARHSDMTKIKEIKRKRSTFAIRFLLRLSGAPVLWGNAALLCPSVPLLGFSIPARFRPGLSAPRIADKNFCPTMFALAVSLLLINRSSAGKGRAELPLRQPRRKRMTASVLWHRVAWCRMGIR
jgi:hypothetical protein